MRLDHLLSKEFFHGSQLWALFFHVVDVAECATAMKYVVPGGRTPSVVVGCLIWMVRWRTAYWWVVCCVVLWVGDAHPRVTEGLKALVHCWVSGAAQVCVSLLGPLS